MAQVDAWVTVAAAAITAAAAVGSAALAQQATRSRDHEARLWQKRSEVYVELTRWLQTVHDQLPPDPDEEASDEELVLSENTLPTAELRAQAMAYVSADLLHDVTRCIERVRAIVGVYSPERPQRRFLTLRELIESIMFEIRQELHPRDHDHLERVARIVTHLHPIYVLRRIKIRRDARRRWKERGSPVFQFGDSE